MAFVGGYTIADMSEVKPNLGTATGNVTVDNIDPVLVSKFKDLTKPVMVNNLTITAEGAEINVAGFGPHIVAAGVHNHHYAGVKISVMGDTSLMFTISAE